MGSALPDVQVLVDWQNNPIGATATAGNNFTDISAYIYWPAGLNISRGRQDNISVVQPSRLTFTVANDDGRFTPGKATSPYYPGVIIGRRVQVNVRDETATWHTRFDGMIAEYDILDTPTGKDTKVQVICTDVLAFLNRYPAFSCWTVQETGYTGTPLFQYLCNDDASGGVLKDSTGSNPPLKPTVYSNRPFYIQPHGGSDSFWDKPAYAFQSGNDPVEGAVDPLSFDVTKAYGFPLSSPIKSPLPSVQFSQTLEQGVGGNTPTSAAASAQFQGQLASPITVTGTSSFTLLGWVWIGEEASDTQISNPFEAICLSNTRTGAMLSLGVDATAADFNYRAKFYSNYLVPSPSGTGTGDANPGTDSSGTWLLGAPLMMAVSVNGTTATFYLAGNVYKHGQQVNTGPSTITIPSGTVFNYLSIGGPLGGGNGWIGNVSLVTMYGSALNSTQIGDLAKFGSIGPETQTTGTVFQRAAFAYTGVPSYWQGTVDSGLSTCDYFDLTGSGPSTVLQNVQSVEHGLVFVDASGKLNFHDRSRRMGATTSPVTLPAGSYDPDIQPKVDGQYLINSASYQNNRGGTGILYQDNTSAAQYGVYGNGSLSSPQTAPYVSFAYTAHVQTSSSPFNFGFADQYSTENITDAVTWDVNTLGQPTQKLASLTVDRLGNTPGQNEYVAPSVLYGVEIDSPIKVAQNLPWWPDSPLSGELFIEGVNESYDTNNGRVTFYTTPAFQSRAWIPGNSTYGQLDVSARVGISDMSAVTGDAFLWPPTPAYGSSMNLGAGVNGFVGARDQAGISGNLQRLVTPPLLYVGQSVNTQTFFGNGFGFVTWDTMSLDTVAGFNLANEGGVSYTVLVAGWYEVYATVIFGSPTTTSLYTVMLTQVQWPSFSTPPSIRRIAPATARGTTGDLGISTSAVMYCYVGDNLSVNAQTDGSSWTTSVANGGSSFSAHYIGQGTNRN